MSYTEAKHCFAETSEILQSPNRDPVAWNLAVGLENLTQAIQADHQEILRLVEVVHREIQDLNR